LAQTTQVVEKQGIVMQFLNVKTNTSGVWQPYEVEEVFKVKAACEDINHNY
jgi:uncharacterized protein YaiE (UPF0345 family)